MFSYSHSLPPPPPKVHRCVANVGSDFYTGVKAALIAKSGNPAWVPASLKDVSCAALLLPHMLPLPL